ncbi:MAG: hypothetical protein VR67_11810 [Peptococcaceae bacterium BRH_c8a]|nr:MAG: hypothetical protein VR67_11810 [Peptococcaceae bacterium BRH_c8a]
MDIIELQIKDALETIPGKAKAENWKYDSLWTRAVKQVLVDIGRANSYQTAANGCDNDNNGEWLYDIVWYQYDRAGHITDVPLVAECEWGNRDAVQADFEKLLVSRAKYRVMVFQSGTDDNIYNIIRNMKLGIHKFSRTSIGDRYLLIGWATDHWVFDQYVIHSK